MFSLDVSGHGMRKWRERLSILVAFRWGDSPFTSLLGRQAL
jgi:hypothetical protein